MHMYKLVLADDEYNRLSEIVKEGRSEYAIGFLMARFIFKKQKGSPQRPKKQ